MEPSTVVIASDNALIRAALRSVLSGAGFNAEHVSRGSDLLGFLQVRKPAVAVLDLVGTADSLVPVEVEATCAQMVGSDSKCRVLLLCEQVDSESVGELVRHGVRGVFTPDMALDLFAKAVEKVIEDEVWFSRSQSGALIGGLEEANTAAQTRQRELPKSPTNREIEVLRLMAAGCDQHQIATHLGVSQHTVRTHIRNVMGKLGVSTRTDAVRVAIGMGLVDASTDP